MTIRTILTDLGNVILLIDENPTVYDKLIKASDGCSYKDVKKAIGFDGGFYREFSKGLIEPEIFYEKICKDLKIKISIEDFRLLWCNIFTPNAQVIDLWRELFLKNYRIVLLSNLDIWLRDWVFSYFRLDFLRQSLCSCDLGCEKPDKIIYHYSFPFCHCGIKEVVFIDDRKENINAARDFGYNVIHYKNFQNLYKELKKLGVKI